MAQEPSQDVLNYFSGLSDEQLISWEKQYENLLQVERTGVVHREDLLGKKKAVKVQTMPWMIPAWTRGLKAVEAEISKRNQLTLWNM